MATKSSNIKKGATVSWTRKNGVKATGRLHAYEDSPYGTWALVNLAEKGRPAEIAKVRPSQLRIV